MNSVAGAADVWVALDERVDPARLRPNLGPWVEVKEFAARGRRGYAMVANGRDLVYYRIGLAEAALLPLLDGTRTTAEVLVEHLRGSGELDFAAVAGLVRTLHEGGFLTDAPVDVDAALRRALAPRGPRARVGRFLDTLMVEWSGAEALTVWLHRHGLRYMFGRVGIALATLVIFAGALAFAVTVSGGHRFELAPESIGIGLVVLLMLNMVIVFVHELGHATALVHFGRRVRGAGFRIYFGTPAFFIDSSDVLMIDRGPRIAQSFAGPYFEMVATAAVALVLWAWPDSSVAPALYSFVLLSGFVLFLNFVPLLELDGYWILSDAIRVPDLRPRSLAFVRRDLWVKLARRDRFTFSEVGLGLYGTLGVAFTIFCLWSAWFFWRRTVGGFVTNTWEAGPVGVLALLVLAAFLIGPVVRALVDFARGVARYLARWFEAARFRGQRHWRIEAAELLDAQPGFDDLPVDVLADIAGRVELRHVPSGTVVARQGERSDAYYLVRRGTVDVIEENPDTGDERLLRTLGPGESFGEIGVATAAPRRATVRSVTPVDLFVIDQGNFDRLLADHIRLPELAPTLQALAELRSLGPFTQLGTEELDRVLEQGSWHPVAPGEAVVTQGEAGDAFYAIESGHFDVITNDEVQGTLGPGDHFGEVALLIGVARTATVRAVTPGRVFRLERGGFDRLLAGAFRRSRLISTSPVVFERE